MIMKTTYSTPDLFTLGELRAIMAQTQSLPDECRIRLVGEDRDPTASNNDDEIAIEWEDA